MPTIPNDARPRVPTGATADGRRNRIAPAVFYYHGPVGAYGEFVQVTERVTKNATAAALSTTSWDVNVSYVLTGETVSDRGVRPRRPFAPPMHNWGAFQLVARVSHLASDPDAFSLGLATAGSSRTAFEWAVGANWYPTSFTKYYLTYERVVFDDDAKGPRAAEDSVVFRAQVAF